MGAFGSKPATPAPKKKPVPAISEIDRAVLDLKNSRDRLQRYRTQLEKDDAKLLKQASAAKQAGKKERALGLLRLRKYKKTQLSSVEDQLLNVLQMVETIDSKQNEKQVLEAMAAGKDSLKKMHQETTVDHVLELMDQIAEEVAVEQEINQILQDVPTLSVADEEAVEAELEALMEGEQQSNPLPELPTAPTTKLPEQEKPAVVAPIKTPERVAVPG